jgi:hypothetical protein
MIANAVKRVLLLVLTSILVLSAGCSHQTFTDAAEGTLTLDGAPLADVHIEFVPEVPEGTSAPGSSAVTDEKGFFRLTRNDNHKPGAVVGKHRVVVFAGRPAQGKDDMNPGSATIQLPPVYANASKTPLLVEVTQEPKTYELRLSKTGTVERR